MEITIGFIIVQIIIGIVGYFAHQEWHFPFTRVMIVAITITLLIPLITLDSQQVLIDHYFDVLPSHAIGAAIGFGVTVLIHWVRDTDTA